MKIIVKLTEKYKCFDWFNRIESTSHKNEYLLIVNYYPYNDENLLFNFEKINKIKLKIQSIGEQ